MDWVNAPKFQVVDAIQFYLGQSDSIDQKAVEF